MDNHPLLTFLIVALVLLVGIVGATYYTLWRHGLL